MQRCFCLPFPVVDESYQESENQPRGHAERRELGTLGARKVASGDDE